MTEDHNKHEPIIPSEDEVTKPSDKDGFHLKDEIEKTEKEGAIQKAKTLINSIISSKKEKKENVVDGQDNDEEKTQADSEISLSARKIKAAKPTAIIIAILIALAVLGNMYAKKSKADLPAQENLSGKTPDMTATSLFGEDFDPKTQSLKSQLLSQKEIEDQVKKRVQEQFRSQNKKLLEMVQMQLNYQASLAEHR